MKQKPKIHRTGEGKWQVDHAPFGFTRTPRSTVHDTFRRAIDAATTRTGGSGGSFEKADQHDYDRGQAPA